MNLQHRGKHLRWARSAVCVTVICVTAMWCRNCEKESMHRPGPVRNLLFFAEQNGRHRGKNSVVSVSTTGLESLSSRPEKSSKRISFGGGSVGTLLL